MKVAILKKHDILFEVLISDLKSARKSLLENIFAQTRYFQKYFLMGRQHCARRFGRIVTYKWLHAFFDHEGELC